MESRREVHESRAFRWIGQPSEEELLGVQPGLLRRTVVSFEPRPLAAPAPAPAPAAPPAPDPLQHVHRWRLGGRDLIALAAVAAAVWFALRGADGLPFNQPGPEPADARDGVATRVMLDRRELGSLPRSVETAGTSGVAGTGSRGSSGSKHDHQNPPPTDDPSQPPLVQATIPGVGTVTVEQPNGPLPEDTTPLPKVPALPDADDTLSGVTASLP